MNLESLSNKELCRLVQGMLLPPGYNQGAIIELVRRFAVLVERDDEHLQRAKGALAFQATRKLP